MLQTQTIYPETLKLLQRLMTDQNFSKFVLVGGTALALHLGHRISIDLDLFTNEPFDLNTILDRLIDEYDFKQSFLAKNTIKGTINGIKIDMIAHRYPWIGRICTDSGIRIASIQDLAAMKLNAVSRSGERIKDFIDLAVLSKDMSLSEMLQSYELKYSQPALIPQKAIIYWEDINHSVPVRMMNNYSSEWDDISQVLMTMYNNPQNKVGLNCSEDNDLAEEYPRGRRR